jgi:hypothetical protein
MLPCHSENSNLASHRILPDWVDMLVLFKSAGLHKIVVDLMSLRWWLSLKQAFVELIKWLGSHRQGNFKVSSRDARFSGSLGIILT